MRIAIPTDDKNHIAAHTGRCLGFAIFDVADGAIQEIEVRGNTMEGRHHHQHGEGEGHAHGGQEQHRSHHGLLDALSDCQLMIAHGMGPRLIEDLERRGIEVCFTRELDLHKAVEAYARGELSLNPLGSACNHKHDENCSH
jgi:predicted Fe-Mo cluster-binding NifX family protein